MATDFFLIGDSNAAVIQRAAKRRNIPFSGGHCAPGRLFDSDFYHVDAGRIVMPPFKTPLAYADLLQFEGPVLSTLGFNTQFMANRIYRDYRQKGQLDSNKLSAAVIDAVVASWKTPALSFYRLLLERGIPVWIVHSPQRFPDNYFRLALRLEDALRTLLRDMGVNFVDVRDETTDADGKLLERFHSSITNDRTHGNVDWGDMVLQRFVECAGLDVASADSNA